MTIERTIKTRATAGAGRRPGKHPDDEAARLLAAVVESSDDAILSLSPEGTIITWNASAERQFGYRAEEMLGENIMRLIPADRHGEEEELMARLRRGERVEHFETKRLTKAGTELDVSLTVSPILDAGGAVAGISKISRDISERKRTEAELAEARASLSARAEELERTVAERTAQLTASVAELEAFSYSLSHDMRAPLRAINTLTHVIVEDYGSSLSPEVLDLLNRVLGAAMRMDRLMQDVLAFSRISRQPIEIRWVDTDKLVRELIRDRPEFHTTGAEILVEGHLLPVMGNEPSLNQCLTNLIGNAIKFVGSGVKPQVRICSEPHGAMVRLYVEDNGIGIEPRAHAKVFEIFQRLHSGYEGTGIGLAIVKKGAERMGGSVGVQSEPGKGSRFWIELRGAPQLALRGKT
jgi:PAS domain S-box-containing protein